MAFHNPVFENVCLSVGHKISVLVRQVYEPVSKSILPETWLGCTACGLELEEIRALSISKKRTRKPKPEAIPQ